MHPTIFQIWFLKINKIWDTYILDICVIFDKYYINARVWWSMPWWQNKAKKAISPVKNKSIGLERPTNSLSGSWASEEMWKTGTKKYEKWSGQKYKFQCLKFPSIIRWWTCVRAAISWAQRDYHSVVSDHHTICTKTNCIQNEHHLHHQPPMQSFGRDPNLFCGTRRLSGGM